MCHTETRELLIRTSLEWRMHRLWEKLRVCCFVVKRKLTREKPFVWDEESMQAAEELNDEPDEEEPFAFTGPDFNPAVTALFSTDYARPLRLISRRVICGTRQKVKIDCQTLVDQGYTDFIVNYGDNYGMIALSELVHLKRSLYPQINLYCGKLYSEHARCFTTLDFMWMMTTCSATGTKFVGSMHPYKFIEKVAWRVSRLSFERGLLEMDKTMPRSMLTHFAIWLIKRYCEV